QRFDRIMQLQILLSTGGAPPSIPDETEEQEGDRKNAYFEEYLLLSLECTERWELSNAVALLSSLAFSLPADSDPRIRCNDAVDVLNERLQSTTFGKQRSEYV